VVEEEIYKLMELSGKESIPPAREAGSPMMTHLSE